MPIRTKPIMISWRRLFWKLVLICLLLLFLSQIAVIWMMGAQETEDAFSSGRRLLVSLDDEEIKGKIVLSTAPEESSTKESGVKDDKEIEDPAIEEKPNVQDIPPQQTTQEAEIVSTIETLPEDKDVELSAITPSNSPTEEFSTELYEKSEFGFLPRISRDGIKPWKYYSKKITATDKKPKISIIVTGLGHNKNVSELALRLPEAMNLSFSPYAKELSSWAISARLSGHEILLDMPMEASDYPASDPGPLGLLVSKEQGENENRIKKLMARDFGYIGFVTPSDEAFLENNDLLKSLLHVISGRGLMLAVGKKPPKDETIEMIESANTASVIIDTVIDEELTPTAIQARLTLLEQTAKQRGYAVGVANSYPLTMKQLSEWAEKSKENGFTIVPVSHIVSKRY